VLTHIERTFKDVRWARVLSSLLLAGAITLVAAGCSKRSSSPNLARTDRAAIEAAGQPVNILDRDLRNRVAADISDVQRLPDGRMRVRVALRNSTRKDLDVLVRTVFKDDLKLSTGDETEWSNLFFAPQQAQTYEAISLSNNPQSFTVEVRRP
jgi:hypothetical protein